jgi:hypothetical protein
MWKIEIYTDVKRISEVEKVFKVHYNVVKFHFNGKGNRRVD